MKQPEPLYKLLDWIHTNKIDWVNLSKNSNPNVISFLEKNPDKIDRFYLSGNQNAIPLLKKYPDKIDWWGLSQNPNPKAIPLLEANQDKIDWNWLLRNPNAIPLIEKILDKINFNILA